MDKRYYREYYTLEREHWWFTVRLQILEDHIRRKIYKGEPLRILNIGVATGATTAMLEKFGRVISLEYDEDCCIFLCDELKMSVINGSILNLPFGEEEFDLVCAFDVIEHVNDDALAVQEMKRVCKTGKNIFITVPALMILWSRHDEVNHHFRRYKMSQVKELFATGSKGSEVFRSYFNTVLFAPIFTFRVFSKLFPRRKATESSGSDFEINNKLANKLLYAIFKAEYYLLRAFRFPVGVSILYSWKKS